jgi:hypothetical protein
MRKINKRFWFFISIFLIIPCFFVLSYRGHSQDTSISSYTATISWRTDKPSTSQVEYGQDPSYGKRTPRGPELVTEHSVTLYNLKPSTLYHYRVRSKDAFGNEAVSSGFTFVTLDEISLDKPPAISQVKADPSISTRSQYAGAKLQGDRGRAKIISDEQAGRIIAAGPKDSAEPDIAGSGTFESGQRSLEGIQLIKKEASIEETLTSRGGGAVAQRHLAGRTRHHLCPYISE